MGVVVKAVVFALGLRRILRFPRRTCNVEYFGRC